ncbi:MAG TPA: M12 family metallo-peptidase, partial [Verrucomicrobiae bacterium]|nr:M12 family metallo-peptidase [Verrucomicrobiae bacterium]
MPLCFGAGSHGRLACLWVAVLAGWIEFIAHAGAPLDKLFSEPEAIARAQANPPRGAKRFRPARLNANLTQDNSSPAFTPLSQFVLNLFPDLQPQVQITQVDALGEGRRVSHGVIDGIPGSHFLLAENSGVITASVFIPGRGSYNIISQGGFNYTITEIDPAQAGDCGADELIAPAKTGHASTVTAAAQLSPPPVIGAQLGPTTDPVSIVDVMVVYTPESLAGAGGTAAMTSLIDLAIAEGNTVYQNSRANVRLRLAYQGLINYAESDSFRTNLTRLQAPGDGFMDDVFALRDTARADVVCLITERGETNLSGLAFTLSTDVAGFKAQAFSVVKRSAAVGTYMFVHEISHNLGCQHDRENALDVNGKPNVPVYSF